jgi:hypothetical protein
VWRSAFVYTQRCGQGRGGDGPDLLCAKFGGFGFVIANRSERYPKWGVVWTDVPPPWNDWRSFLTSTIRTIPA